MTNKSAFTPEEWWLLKETPLRVGAAVMVASESGVGGTMKEIVANAQAFAKAVAQFPNDELIQALSDPDDSSTYLPPPPATAGADRYAREARIKSDALDKCRQAIDVLMRKASAGEVEAYRKWVMTVGENVACAAGEGGVLGMGKKPVSDEEVAVLKQLADALGLKSYSPLEK
jgi:hypothetical protein